MLKRIQERRRDKFVARLNNHWHTKMIRESKAERLPHSVVNPRKEGKVYHDYCGQNTPLDSFKNPWELFYSDRQSEIKVISLYEKVIRVITREEYKKWEVDIILPCYKERLSMSQEATLSNIGFSIKYLRSIQSGELLVNLTRKKFVSGIV